METSAHGNCAAFDRAVSDSWCFNAIATYGKFRNKHMSRIHKFWKLTVLLGSLKNRAGKHEWGGGEGKHGWGGRRGSMGGVGGGGSKMSSVKLLYWFSDATAAVVIYTWEHDTGMKWYYLCFSKINQVRDIWRKITVNHRNKSTARDVTWVRDLQGKIYNHILNRNAQLAKSLTF